MQEAPRSAPLTQDRVVDEALTIADTDGFAAVSLRAVARRLGVTPMALYRYVESSEQLGDLVVSRVVGERTARLAWPDDPRAALHLLASTVVDLIQSHPAMLERYEQRGVFTPPAMRLVNGLLAVLCRHGLSGEEAVRAYATIHFQALGYAALAARQPATHVQQVPDAHDYPVLAAHFEAWQSLGSDTTFRTGLDVVIDAVLAR